MPVIVSGNTAAATLMIAGKATATIALAGAAADHAVFYPLPRASASADRRDDASGTGRDRRLTP